MTELGYGAPPHPHPGRMCVFLLPQCIYSLSQSHHTHNIISELLHPHRHPWYAFPLACIFKLSLLSPSCYLSSICFSSFQNYLMGSSFILFFSIPLTALLATIRRYCFQPPMFEGDQPHLCPLAWLPEVGRQGESKQYLPLIPKIALPITSPWLS